MSEYYYSGKFGIERETLRIDSHGRLARTPHPFGNDEHITRDFCENQVELVTPVAGSIEEAVSAEKSTYLSDIIDYLPPQKAALAHIRFATVGTINEHNCHPFTGTDISGREWTLIHNGTIFSSRHNHRYSAVQTGDTDSERFFLSLLDNMNEHIARSVPNERERFEIVNKFIVENAPRNKLNLMIYDGELLYVHTSMLNARCFPMNSARCSVTD